MSGAISSGYGIMPTLMRSVDKLNAQNDAFTAQLTGGVTSNSYAGLGDMADEAISLQPQITATKAWQSSLAQIQTKLSITQTALTSIDSIANNIQTTLLSLQSNPSATTIAVASASATQQLTQLMSLLNTRSGDTYVFAGTASDQAPMASSDLASSNLVTSIKNAVVQGKTAAEISGLATASFGSAATSVFSVQLSSAQTVDPATLVPSVQVGQHDTIATGIVATQGGASSVSSTGSPIMDLITTLATVAGLSGADSGTSAFQTLVSATSSQVAPTIQGLTTLVALIGTLQNNATTRSSNLSDVNSALTSQLDAVKGSDPVATRTQQVAVQNQLTASYTLIADMKNLNLAQYI